MVIALQKEDSTDHRVSFSKMIDTSDEQLIEEALGFNSASELQTKARALYEELKRRDLYESRVRPILIAKTKSEAAPPNPYAGETDRQLLQNAQTYTGRMDLTRHNPDLRAELESRNLWETALPRRARTQWTDAKLRKEAARYDSAADMREANPDAFREMVNRGLVEDLFEDASAEPGRKWTEDTIREAAKKCTSRTEFHGKYPGAYAAARTAGILDDVCAHMPYYSRRKTAAGMTNAELIQLASKYDSPSAFLRGDRSAYNQTVRRGIFAQIAKANGW